MSAVSRTSSCSTAVSAVLGTKHFVRGGHGDDFLSPCSSLQRTYFLQWDGLTKKLSPWNVVSRAKSIKGAIIWLFPSASIRFQSIEFSKILILVHLNWVILRIQWDLQWHSSRNKICFFIFFHWFSVHMLSNTNKIEVSKLNTMRFNFISFLKNLETGQTCQSCYNDRNRVRTDNTLLFQEI